MQYREMMEQCDNYIKKHLLDTLTVKELAELCGYSVSHFCYVFKTWHGMTLVEYIRKKRLEQAAEEIREGKSITETAYDYGFATGAGFSKAFRKQFGMSAKEYQQKENNIEKDFYRMDGQSEG